MNLFAVFLSGRFQAHMRNEPGISYLVTFQLALCFGFIAVAIFLEAINILRAG